MLTANTLQHHAAHCPLRIGQRGEFDPPNVVFLVEEFDSVIVGLPALFNLSHYARVGLQSSRKAADSNFLLRYELARQGNFPTVTADHESASAVEELHPQAICPRNFYRDFDFNAITCTFSCCLHTGTHLDQGIHYGIGVMALS